MITDSAQPSASQDQSLRKVGQILACKGLIEQRLSRWQPEPVDQTT